MYSLSLKAIAAVSIGALAAYAVWPRPASTIRVCAEPDAMPYSNRDAEGFENKLATMFAHDRNARLEYAWLEERRGSFDQMLSRGECDLIMGVPTGVSFAEVSRPYYRSSYMLVYRTNGPAYASLDDPRLREARIGVQVIGDDFANTPPAFALARRNLLDNMSPFLMYSSTGGKKAQSELIAAVANRSVDVAIEWGPYAGYFASRQPDGLELATLPSDGDLEFAYDIGIGFSHASALALKPAIDEFLTRRRTEIERLLRDYAIPHVQI